MDAQIDTYTYLEKLANGDEKFPSSPRDIGFDSFMAKRDLVFILMAAVVNSDECDWHSLMALRWNRQTLRSLFSFGSGSGSRAGPSSKTNQQRLVEELKSQFVEKLEKTGSAEASWKEYSQLMDSMLEKVNLSVVSHRRLIGDISSTPVPISLSASKTKVLTKIIGKLGKNATLAEYARMANIFERQNDMVKLKSLLTQMKEAGISPSTAIWNSLIRLNLRRGDIEAAMSIFESLRPSKGNRNHDVEANGSTYLAVMDTMYRDGKFAMVESLYQEMLDNDISVPLSCIHILMSTHMKRGAFKEVLTLFEEVKSRNLKASTYTYQLYLQSLLSLGDFDGALNVLGEMESTATNTPQADTGIYNAFLSSALANMSKNLYEDLEIYLLSLSMLSRMKSKQNSIDLQNQLAPISNKAPDATTYEIVISIACRQASLESLLKAHDLLLEMQSKGFVASVRLWSYLVKSFCGCGYALGAWKVLESSNSSLPSGVNIRQHVLQGLLVALLEKNDLEKAVAVFSSIQKSASHLDFNITHALLEKLLLERSLSKFPTAVDLAWEHISESQIFRLWSSTLSKVVDNYEHCQEIASSISKRLRPSRTGSHIVPSAFVDTVYITIARLADDPIVELCSILEDGAGQHTLVNLPKSYHCDAPSTSALLQISKILVKRRFSPSGLSELVKAAKNLEDRRPFVVLSTIKDALCEGVRSPQFKSESLNEKDKEELSIFLLEKGVWVI
ncbi:hypothetical protein HDU97_001524 [Phlyctochytrium planicorne]|nr:hypothetical protein HDU97_001524 [Phlyctochytrium planicorne]